MFAVAIAVASSLMLVAPDARAIPAFNRQTGQNCVACHAGGQFPELTPYGRLFKLTGYTIGERAMPLSAMGIASYNKTRSTSSADPAFDGPATFPKNGNLVFQTASVFAAGRITDNLGAFVQYTYNNYDHQRQSDSRWIGHASSDNLDVRYADRFITPDRDLIVGLTLNNNPSVQDPWNSASAWGFNVVPGSTGPAAAPMVSGRSRAERRGPGSLCLLESHVVRRALLLSHRERLLVLHEPWLQCAPGRPAGREGRESVLARGVYA